MKRVGRGVYRGRLGTAGRLVLPHDLREAFGVGPGDWVTVRAAGKQLIVSFGFESTTGGEDGTAVLGGAGRERQDSRDGDD
ncbi:MAG: AbrB/MazE/SpoVT family DNA-binding domain-containing protein [Gemmataceae bacterium]|nr:AbrB/MazE/SpoVT family DNA-binding domain-containing protein [Gemmataceae bacterium]